MTDLIHEQEKTPAGRAGLGVLSIRGGADVAQFTRQYNHKGIAHDKKISKQPACFARNGTFVPIGELAARILTNFPSKHGEGC